MALRDFPRVYITIPPSPPENKTGSQQRITEATALPLMLRDGLHI